MYNFTRSVIKCRFIVRCVSFAVKSQVNLTASASHFSVNLCRNMAQKSITSFFTITPKKPAVVKKETKDVEVETKTNGVSQDVSDIEKQSSKRQRLDSSGSESNSTLQKTPGSEKKKKVKRQRIESSGSEAEAEASTSPIVKEEKESESKTSPKTKPSPKTKKAKAKVETPSSQKKNNEESKRKSPSPKSKVKVKEEVLSPKVEKSEVVASVLNGKSPVEEKESKHSDTNSDQQNDGKPKVPATEYNPAKAKYHPIEDACWARDEAVPYLALARTLQLVEATSARLKMVDTLANYLRSVIVLTPQDLLPSVYMCLNQLAPAYHSLELGIAETYLMKAIGQCTGRSLAQVRAAAARCGDLGAAAQQARATQRTMFAPPPLTARRVFAALREIAHMTGHASVNKKIAKIQSLFTACRHCEAKYLIRSLEGKLRVGLAEQSLLQALAQAAALTPPGAAAGSVLDASKGRPPDEFKVRERAVHVRVEVRRRARADPRAGRGRRRRARLQRRRRLQPQPGEQHQQVPGRAAAAAGAAARERHQLRAGLRGRRLRHRREEDPALPGAVDAQAQRSSRVGDQGAGVRVRVRPAVPERRAARAPPARRAPPAAAGTLPGGRGRVAVRHVEGLQHHGGGAAVPGGGGEGLVRGADGEDADGRPRALRHRAPLAQLAQAEERLPRRRGRHDRRGGDRRVPRARQARGRVRRLPAGVLRAGRRPVPGAVQDRHRLQRRRPAGAHQGAGPARHRGSEELLLLRPVARAGRVVQRGVRVGGALRRPVAVARAPRRHRPRRARQGHLAALPQVHPRAHGQDAGAGDVGAADRRDVPRAGPGQEPAQEASRLRRLLLNTTRCHVAQSESPSIVHKDSASLVVILN